MGGGLLQQCDRDTQEFAMKCSSVTVNGEHRDVFKDPITASNKASKRGRVLLWASGGQYQTAVSRPTDWTDKGFEWKDAMVTYFENGAVKFTQTFEEVRANSNL